MGAQGRAFRVPGVPCIEERHDLHTNVGFDAPPNREAGFNGSDYAVVANELILAIPAYCVSPTHGKLFEGEESLRGQLAVDPRYDLHPEPGQPPRPLELCEPGHELAIGRIPRVGGLQSTVHGADGPAPQQRRYRVGLANLGGREGCHQPGCGGQRRRRSNPGGGPGRRRPAALACADCGSRWRADRIESILGSILVSGM